MAARPSAFSPAFPPALARPCFAARAAALPAESVLQPLRRPGDFLDCFAASLSPDLRAEPIGELALRAVGRFPAWARGLMSLRDVLVRPFGLRGTAELGATPPADPSDLRLGERIGPFPLLHIAEEELILGADDRHLDFRISVIRPREAPDELRLATLVKPRNRFGRVYLTAILPFHVAIARQAASSVSGPLDGRGDRPQKPVHD